MGKGLFVILAAASILLGVVVGGIVWLVTVLAAADAGSYFSRQGTTASVLLIVRDEHGLIQPGQTIYIASNKNGWNPGDDRWQMTHEGEGIYTKELGQSRDFEFKLTLGGWERVETDPDGFSIDNRVMRDLIRQRGDGRTVVEIVPERFLKPGEIENELAKTEQTGPNPSQHPAPSTPPDSEHPGRDSNPRPAD